MSHEACVSSILNEWHLPGNTRTCSLIDNLDYRKIQNSLVNYWNIMIGDHYTLFRMRYLKNIPFSPEACKQICLYKKRYTKKSYHDVSKSMDKRFDLMPKFGNKA